ncbi:HTH-type sugar sensing transcriptional regulator TrmBL1 [uncultured archaeon]|nr:HTH-type sugar sensing transcriptional regulator TrmBL1 [uncultured archaeon]
MDTDLLREIGLTDGEAKVYLSLLGLGDTKAGALAKTAGMQRSAVYFCLERLAAKGLAASIVKNNRRVYSAAPPGAVLDYLEQKKQALETQRKMAEEKLLPLLLSSGGRAQDGQQAKMYDGWKGVENAFRECISGCKPTDGCAAFSITSVFGGAEPKRVARLISRVRAFREENKIAMRVLASERNEIAIGQEKTRRTTVRYLRSSSPSAAVVNIYGASVLFAIWVERPVALIVRSNELSKSLMGQFDSLWKIARERP